MPDHDPSDLAPTGTLRVGVVEAPNAGAFFVARDPASGALRGVTVALGRVLAERIGVPVDYQVFPNSGECTQATAAATLDVAFMPVDDLRRGRVAFGPAYYLIESTFLVTAASGVSDLAGVDQARIRVVGIADTTTIRAATRSLRHTTPVAIVSVAEAVERVRSGRADALALSRDSLAPLVATIPGSLIVAGGFQQTSVSIAVPPGRPQALAQASAFIEAAKASGLLRTICDEAGVAAAGIAPAGR